MQKLKIENRTKLEIEIYDRVFHITRPTVSQTENIYETLKTISADTSVGSASAAWRDFLGSLGIDTDFLKTVEPDHLMQLIDFVTGSKKK